MSFGPLPEPLRGIIVPMVSPLAAVDELDEPGVERLVEHLIAGGVHGLFLLGTSGEGPSLSHQLRRQLVDRACSIVDGRLPVLVGITDTSYAESLALAADAAEAGANALVVAPPYYFPVEQPELVEYVQHLARAVPLPLVLYNMPSLTKMSFEPDTVRRLMDEPTIIGMKDSSGDIEYFKKVRQITRGRPDWTLLVGPERLLAESMRLGGDGGIAAGANVWPRLFVDLYQAVVAGEDDVVAALAAKVSCLHRIYETGPARASSAVKGLKMALAVLGICGQVVAEPLGQPTAEAVRQVEAILRSLGIAPASSHDDRLP